MTSHLGGVAPAVLGRGHFLCMPRKSGTSKVGLNRIYCASVKLLTENLVPPAFATLPAKPIVRYIDSPRPNSDSRAPGALKNLQLGAFRSEQDTPPVFPARIRLSYQLRRWRGAGRAYARRGLDFPITTTSAVSKPGRKSHEEK